MFSPLRGCKAGNAPDPTHTGTWPYYHCQALILNLYCLYEVLVECSAVQMDTADCRQSFTFSLSTSGTRTLCLRETCSPRWASDAWMEHGAQLKPSLLYTKTTSNSLLSFVNTWTVLLWDKLLICISYKVIATTITDVTPALTVQCKLDNLDHVWIFPNQKLAVLRWKKNSCNISWQLLLASSLSNSHQCESMSDTLCCWGINVTYLSSAGTNVKGLPTDGCGSVLVLVLPWSRASLLSHLVVFRCLYHRLSQRSGPERGVTSLGPLEPLLGENYRQANNNHTYWFHQTHRTKHISTHSESCFWCDTKVKI